MATSMMAAYGLVSLLIFLLAASSACQESSSTAAALDGLVANNTTWQHTPAHVNTFYGDDDDDDDEFRERYARTHPRDYDADDHDKYEVERQSRSSRYRHGHDGTRGYSEESRHRHSFVLNIDDDVHKTILRSEAGELKFFLPWDTNKNEIARQRIGLSFLTIEPNALLLPHYTDSDYLFVVNKGGGLLSWIDGEDLQKLDLEEGDVYKIESGTVFYFLNHHDQNHGKHQRMHIFGIHDLAGEPGFSSSTTARRGFINVAGAETILSGFDEDVLATAFNVSSDDAYDLLTSPLIEGPFIYHASARNESTIVPVGRNESREVPVARNESMSSAEQPGLVNVLLDVLLEDANSILPSILKKETDTPDKKVLNIFRKEPNFSNQYGSTSVADENDSALLKQVNKGVFWVKLKPDAMLAPHWNPRGMEVAVVTNGEGEIQIVSPDGHGGSGNRGEKVKVREGSVFYVPRNFGMCQIASSSGKPLEFVGFSTSSRPNHPRFLAGSSSVLKKVNADVLASAFNVPTDYAKGFFGKQSEAVIVPVAVHREEEEEDEEAVEPEPEEATEAQQKSKEQ